MSRVTAIPTAPDSAGPPDDILFLQTSQVSAMTYLHSLNACHTVNNPKIVNKCEMKSTWRLEKDQETKQNAQTQQQTGTKLKELAGVRVGSKPNPKTT